MKVVVAAQHQFSSIWTFSICFYECKQIFSLHCAPAVFSTLYLHRNVFEHGEIFIFPCFESCESLPVQSDLERRWSAVSNALWGSYVTQHGGKATGVFVFFLFSSPVSPFSFTLPLPLQFFFPLNTFATSAHAQSFCPHASSPHQLKGLSLPRGFRSKNIL